MPMSLPIVYFTSTSITVAVPDLRFDDGDADAAAHREVAADLGGFGEISMPPPPASFTRPSWRPFSSTATACFGDLEPFESAPIVYS